MFDFPLSSAVAVASALIATAGALWGCAAAPDPAAPVAADEAVQTTPIDAAGGRASDRGPAAMPVAGAERREEVTPIDWSQAPDCPTVLGWLQAAAAAERLGPDDRVPIAILLPDATTDDGWLAPASLEVAVDLPISLIDGNTGGADLEAPCVIQVGHPGGQRSAKRVIAEDQVRSLYQSGVRSERNPDYDLVSARVKQLERDLRGGDIDLIRVGNPLLDLVGQVVSGVIEGFDRGQSEGALNEALTELATTPRSLDRPVYRPYHFDRVVVQAAKEAVVPVTLHDRTTGAVRTAQLRQRERREFFILDGLDPRDQDYRQWRQASIDEQGLRRWLEAPPKLASTALVAALLDAPASDRDAGILVAAPPGAGSPPPQALPPRSIEIAATAPSPSSRQSLEGAVATWRHDDGTPAPTDRGGAGDDQGGSNADDEPLPAAETLLVGTARVEPRSGLRVQPDVGSPWGRQPPIQTGRAAIEVGATAPQAPASASRSMVWIVVGARAGSGFYVGRDRVLTTARLVAGANVVEVIGADGVNVLGVVARTDPFHDLALVHMPRPGQPIDVAAQAGEAGPGVLAVGRQGDAGLVPVTVGQASAAATPLGAEAPAAVMPVSAAAVLAFIKGAPTAPGRP